MEIGYRTKKLRKVCTDASAAEKTYGRRMAEIIQMRIDQIHAAESVEELIQYHIGRCHLLKQDRRGQYAMDLEQPYRLVFIKDEGGIQAVEIWEIVDYH